MAAALLSEFRDRNIMVVATTHHRNVARLAQDQTGMVNASVDLNPRTLEPTYQLTNGVPGRSYALIIASRLGLPETVITTAKTHLEPSHIRTDQLLQELQEERLTVAELRNQAEQSLTEARQRQEEADQRLSVVEDTKAELVEEARRALTEQIGQLLNQIRQAERSLQRQQSDAAAENSLASGTPETRPGPARSCFARLEPDPRGAATLVCRPAGW